MPKPKGTRRGRHHTRRRNQHHRRRGATPDVTPGDVRRERATPAQPRRPVPPIWPPPPPGTEEYQSYAWAVQQILANARALYEEANDTMPAILRNLAAGCDLWRGDDKFDLLVFEDLRDQHLAFNDELAVENQALNYYQQELQDGRLVDLYEAIVTYVGVKQVYDVVKSLHHVAKKLADKRLKTNEMNERAAVRIDVVGAVVLLLAALPHAVLYLETPAVWLFNAVCWFAITNNFLYLFKSILKFLGFCALYYLWVYRVGALLPGGVEQTLPAEEATRMSEPTNN
ncbi:hypothetical protein PG993_013353 [Apiospora rasikravindrae]|uniref:Uncharacterized protein n=1 Tax=Apiospora rasikravindrae TaxID=990691 RepID=A0ABR1RXE6_9PEZI